MVATLRSTFSNSIHQIKNQNKMETYVHNIKLNSNDDFAKRFNYVSWLWQRYRETEDEKYWNEHFEAKLALEQGYPISFLTEYEKSQ